MGIAGLGWLILGFMFLSNPVNAFVAGSFLAVFIAFTLILSGAIETIAWAFAPKEAKRFWTLASGLIVLVLGIVLLNKPLILLISIPYLLAFVLLSRGIIEIVGAVQAKSLGFKGWILILVSGVLALALGFLMLISPFQTAIAYIGISLVFYGALEIAAALGTREPEGLV